MLVHWPDTLSVDREMKKPRLGKDGEFTVALLVPNLTTKVGLHKTKEGAMANETFVLMAKRAVLVMAEIKAATEAFDRGDTNVFDALETVRCAIEAYAKAKESRRKAA